MASSQEKLGYLTLERAGRQNLEELWNLIFFNDFKIWSHWFLWVICKNILLFQRDYILLSLEKDLSLSLIPALLSIVFKFTNLLSLAALKSACQMSPSCYNFGTWKASHKILMYSQIWMLNVEVFMLDDHLCQGMDRLIHQSYYILMQWQIKEVYHACMRKITGFIFYCDNVS